MDSKASSGKNLFSGLRLLHSQALLDAGSTAEQLFQAAINGKSAIRTLPGIIMGGKGRMSAAIYSPFEPLSSYGRIEHALGRALPLFCENNGIKAQWLHVHAPMRNHGGFNPAYLETFLKSRFPQAEQVHTQGNYCDGLMKVLKQIPRPEQSILSIAVDSMVDHQSIRNYLQKHRCQPTIFPGEAYVFFHFQKTYTPGCYHYYSGSDAIKDFQNKLKHNKQSLAYICYPELIRKKSIEQLLDFQRVLFQGHEKINHPCQWLSSHSLCGYSGAAQEAVSFLLSHGAALSNPEQSVVMLNPDKSFIEFRKVQ